MKPRNPFLGTGLVDLDSMSRDQTQDEINRLRSSSQRIRRMMSMRDAKNARTPVRNPLPAKSPLQPPVDQVIDTGGFLDFYNRQVQPGNTPFQGNEDPSLSETVAPSELAQPPDFKYTAEPIPRINPNWSGLADWQASQGGGGSGSPPSSSGFLADLGPGNIPGVPGEDYIPFVPPWMTDGKENPFTPPENTEAPFPGRRGPMPPPEAPYQPGPIVAPRMPPPPGQPKNPYEGGGQPQPQPGYGQQQGGISDLFRPYGSGLQDSPYGNLMDSIAEYGAGYNPYGQMGDYLMNRPVFDRGERPGSPMDMFRTPTSGGAGDLFDTALGQMREQAPVIQQQQQDFQDQLAQQQADREAKARADAEAQAAAQAEADKAMQARFDELNQRLADQEAAAAAREQEYRTAGQSERDELLARIAELEGRKPDIEAIKSQLDLPNINVDELRQQIAESIGTGRSVVPEETIAQIRQQVQDSLGLGDLNERIAAIQAAQTDLSGKVQAQPQIDVDALRSQIQEGLGNIDIDAIRQQVQEGINVPNIDIDAIRQQVQQGLNVPQVDLSGIESRIQELQGKIPQNIDVDALRQQIQEGISVPDISGLQERIAQVEGRKGPDLSGIEQRIKELQGREIPDLGSIEERLAQVEGRGTALPPDVQARIDQILDAQKAIEARDAKAARTPVRQPVPDKKDTKQFIPVPTVPPPTPKVIPRAPTPTPKVAPRIPARRIGRGR